MTCPHPLDPLCVALLLRLAQGPAGSCALAESLDVDRRMVDERLSRMEPIGAVTSDPESGVYSMVCDADRVILRLSQRDSGLDTGLTTRDANGAFRDRLTRLQQEPMFRELPQEELVWLARVSRTQDLMPGEVLLIEGDDCRGLYITDRGTIRLSKGSTSHAFGYGREQTIRLMTEGESFNEVPVFDGGPNPVTAQAIDEARVILVPKQEVQDLVRRSPRFAGVIIGIMSQRLRHMLAMIEDVSMRDVTGRVAKIVLQMTHPTVGVGAGLTNGRRVTQREIAEMAGTAREVVARVLKKMEAAGAIRVKRGEVRILDPDLLETFV